MNNLRCKFNPIGNLSPHYTLTVVIDRTVDRTMDCGSKLKKPPPKDRRGSWIGAQETPPPPLLPSLRCHTLNPLAYNPQSRLSMGVFLAAVGWVDPPLPSPPPWLATAGQKWLGGNLAKIKENEEKTATLGVPRGASHPLLTCGYVCQCIWGH